MTVKTRKQGNSLMIAIPVEFKVEENAEYEPMIDENGVLSFTPVHQNIFGQNSNYDFKAAMKQMNLTDNGKAIGKENFW
mgnify:FL=1